MHSCWQGQEVRGFQDNDNQTNQCYEEIVSIECGDFSSGTVDLV